jgi:ribonuclease/clavin/mitogillin
LNKGTNTYLIGKGSKRLLIDTGEGRPEWLQMLKDTLKSENAVLDTVLVTHWHPDHVGGIEDVLTLDPPPVVRKNQPPAGQPDIEHDQKFIVEGATVRAFHCPGHAKDHMAFILEEEDAIFTGDNVLGHGTAVFEDLPTYLRSLDAMSKQIAGRGYPGHGAVIDVAKVKIREYIDHRALREKEVVEVLARGTEGEGLGSMDLVKIIYQDTPENLHFAAARGVVQILEKLVGEGKVQHNEDSNTWALTERAFL